MTQNHPHPLTLSARVKNQRADYEDLGPNVLLIGGNGSGKTAVLNGLQLATTGAARDYAGRDEVKLKAALQSLDPDGQDDARADVVFDDGSTATWSLKDGQSGRTLRMIYEEAEAALVGTNIKGRALPWLCENFVPANVVRATRPEIEEATLAAFVAYRDMHKDKTGTDGLVAIYESAKKDAYAAKRQVKKYAECEKVLSELNNDGAVALLASIGALTGFQVAKGMTKCGVCGQEATEDIYADRLGMVNFALPDRVRTGTWVPKALTDHLMLLAQEEQAMFEHSQRVADVALDWMEAALRLHAKEISQQVNKFLPEDLHINLDVTSKRWAILRDGFEAHSGAETVVIISAFAAAASSRSRVPCLLVPPDRAYDDSRVRALMDIIAVAPCGGWLQIVSAPRGRPRKGWTYLEIGDSE